MVGVTKIGGKIQIKTYSNSIYTGRLPHDWLSKEAEVAELTDHLELARPLSFRPDASAEKAPTGHQSNGTVASPWGSAASP